VTRSIGRRQRIGRLAAAGAALVALGLASGCSAGQLAETSRIVPAVPGGSVSVPVPDPSNPNSSILVQNATVAYAPAGYQAGSAAPLVMRIFNQTLKPITVTPGEVSLQSNTGGAATPLGTLTWTSPTMLPLLGAVPSAAPSDSGAPSANPSSGPSDAPSGAPTDTPSSAPSAPASAPAVQVAPAGITILDPSQSQFLVITDLKQKLMPGDVVNVTLMFDDGGRQFSGTVGAAFVPPTGPTASS
jgi:hypothetical protein